MGEHDIEVYIELQGTVVSQTASCSTVHSVTAIHSGYLTPVTTADNFHHVLRI